MKPEEIAAYIGAAAWLPQILGLAYRAIVKPEIRFVPEEKGSIGFTVYGPIFNVRMAFFVEHRDIIVDGVKLSIRHEDGECREFWWAGLGETFSEITDAVGNKQTIARDQSPIAVKISIQTFLEKMVRFQVPRFHEQDATILRNLIEAFNFLKLKYPDDFAERVLNSREYFDLISFRQKEFWWKPGRYDVTLKVTSPQSFNLRNPQFSFSLSAVDVDILKKNIQLIETELCNVVSSNINGFELKQFSFHWVDVKISRHQ